MEVQSHRSSCPAEVLATPPSEKESAKETAGYRELVQKTNGLQKLVEALVTRDEQIQQRKATATKYSRIMGILFPSSIDKSVVKEIVKVAHRVYFLCKDGQYGVLPDYLDAGMQIYPLAAVLHKLQKAYPAEFKVALPGLKAKDLTLIYNTIGVFGSLQKLMLSFQIVDPKQVERHTNLACKHWINCGIPANDSALSHFRNECLSAGQLIRQAASKVAPAA